MTTGLKRSRVYLDRQRQCGDRTHPGDCGQALADLIGFMHGGHFDIDFPDPGVEGLDLLAQQGDHVFGFGWDGRLLFNGGQKWTDLTDALGGDYAEFRAVAAERIDELGPLTNQDLAYLQDHALSLLRDGLHRYEMHVWSCRCFIDCLGVVAVILATPDIGFDVLRRDQTHRVTERGQFPGPMVRASTGFHRDAGRHKLLEKGQKLRTADINS